MDTETLRPDAPGDECLIPDQTGAACPNHYQNVDEETPDEDDTRVVSNNTDDLWYRDLYNIANHSVGSGTINFIKVYARTRQWTDPATQTGLKIAIKTGGVAYEGAEIELDGVYTNYSNQWNTNPGNAHTWTWDEIDALQIGLALRRSTATATSKCTQVYVEVDYTPPAIAKRSYGYIMG